MVKPVIPLFSQANYYESGDSLVKYMSSAYTSSRALLWVLAVASVAYTTAVSMLLH